MDELKNKCLDALGETWVNDVNLLAKRNNEENQRNNDRAIQYLDATGFVEFCIMKWSSIKERDQSYCNGENIARKIRELKEERDVQLKIVNQLESTKNKIQRLDANNISIDELDHIIRSIKEKYWLDDHQRVIKENKHIDSNYQFACFVNDLLSMVGKKSPNSKNATTEKLNPITRLLSVFYDSDSLAVSMQEKARKRS